MKYLELYKKWMETGFIEDAPHTMGEGGLCNTVIGRENMEIFEPEEPAPIYYGFKQELPELLISNNDEKYKFTEWRQNAVLFLAAMNGEL